MRIISLGVDGSEESRQAQDLLASKGITVPVEMATAEDRKESRYPRLVTDEGSLIGLDKIRLVLG